eukprot:4910040-Prymnesium_polylepis.2
MSRECRMRASELLHGVGRARLRGERGDRTTQTSPPRTAVPTWQHQHAAAFSNSTLRPNLV